MVVGHGDRGVFLAGSRLANAWRFPSFDDYYEGTAPLAAHHVLCGMPVLEAGNHTARNPSD
jgi:hypothetical protein